MKCKVLVVILLCAGCIPTTMQVQTLTNDVDELMVVMDKVQERIVITNEAIKEKADESALDQLAAANEASRPFNPYADEVNAVLGLVTVIGGIWAKGEHDKNKNLEKGINRVKGEAEPQLAKKIHDTMKVYT